MVHKKNFSLISALLIITSIRAMEDIPAIYIENVTDNPHTICFDKTTMPDDPSCPWEIISFTLTSGQALKLPLGIIETKPAPFKHIWIPDEIYRHGATSELKKTNKKLATCVIRYDLSTTQNIWLHESATHDGTKLPIMPGAFYCIGYDATDQICLTQCKPCK